MEIARAADVSLKPVHAAQERVAGVVGAGDVTRACIGHAPVDATAQPGEARDRPDQADRPIERHPACQDDDRVETGLRLTRQAFDLAR